MIKKYVQGRVAVYIDAANILYSQQTLGWQVDYKKLIEYFETEINLVSANFYSGRISQKSAQNKFFAKMESFGYRITTKEVKWIKDRGNKVLKGKGNLDIELAIDMSQGVDSYDWAILFSGDSDFAPLVKFVQSRGKKVVVISTKYHISKELAEAADKYINLKKLKEFIAKV